MTGDKKAERINKGTVMHQIFERIKRTSDVEPAVNQMITSGILNMEEGRDLTLKISALLKVSPFQNGLVNSGRY